MQTKFRFYEKYFSKVCDECNGNGYWEKFAGCNASQSDCCGGCYVDVKCEPCDGEGRIYDHFAYRTDTRKIYKDTITDIKYFRALCWSSLHKFRQNKKPFKNL